MAVTMTCMTTKQKFEVEHPPVVQLANGRYAYRVECPWKGKTGQTLFAFKFCSKAAFEEWVEYQQEGTDEDETSEIPSDS